jgi:hypothetical protein
MDILKSCVDYSAISCTLKVSFWPKIVRFYLLHVRFVDRLCSQLGQFVVMNHSSACYVSNQVVINGAYKMSLVHSNMMCLQGGWCA